MGKVVDKVGVELLSEEAEWRGLLSDAQFGHRMVLSAIVAAAFKADRAHAAWTDRDMTVLLQLNIVAAFPSVEKGRLRNEIKAMHVDGDLIRWMERFLSQRTVGMIGKGNDMTRHTTIQQIRAGKKKVLAKQKQRDKSTTTTAIKKTDGGNRF